MDRMIPMEPETDPIGPEERAERHVNAIMGPAWSNKSALDGEAPATAEPAAPLPEPSVLEPTPSTQIAVKREQAPINETSPDLTPLPVKPEPIDVPVGAEPPAPEEVAAQNTPEGTSPAVNATAEAGDAAEPPIVMKLSAFGRLKEWFYRWWDNKVARYATLAGIAVILGIIVAVPPIRIGAMNLLGFRASVSVYAVDTTTLQPLSGVTLSADDKSVKTGESGKAKLTGVKLGRHTVVVHKAGFADVKEQVSFGFRAVDLGEIDMKATGLQLGYTFTDYLSGKPLADVIVESGESSTKSDKTGKAIITLAPDSGVDTVAAHKDGYRTEQFKIDGEQGSVKQVKLVVGAKEVYIARENGIYNLKKIDIDGQNGSTLLAGTGTETAALDVSVDPMSQYAALISTRDDVKNKGGYLLSALTLVDISTGESKTIEHAEKLTVIGWSGTTLVYSQVVAGTSAANPAREKLIAYNYAADKRYQIAAANHFLGAELYSGTLYYAVSSTDPNAKSGLMRSALDGTGKKMIQEFDLWGVYRADYKTLRLQTPVKWYSYPFGGQANEIAAVTVASRSYLDSNDMKLSVWSEKGTTSGMLSSYNIATGKDQTLTKTKGQYKPLRWLNSRTLIYREATKTGGTDYVLNLDGGDARKVADTPVF